MFFKCLDRQLYAGQKQATQVSGGQQPKGKSHALYDRCCTAYPVAAWLGHVLYAGWIHSHPSGGSHCYGTAEGHSGRAAPVKPIQSTPRILL